LAICAPRILLQKSCINLNICMLTLPQRSELSCEGGKVGGYNFASAYLFIFIVAELSTSFLGKRTGPNRTVSLRSVPIRSVFRLESHLKCISHAMMMTATMAMGAILGTGNWEPAHFHCKCTASGDGSNICGTNISCNSNGK